MDAHSESKLVGVEPDLVRVMRAASQIPQPFVVVCGLRSAAAEADAVSSGHSQTLHSRHFADQAGLACAVDVMAMIGGKGSFAKGQEAAVFGKIAAQVKEAAGRLGVPIEWGGDAVGAWTPGVVSHFRDWGHFQLPWKQYP